MDTQVWQLVDSGLPAGGFAHSFGLEAAWYLEVLDGSRDGSQSAVVDLERCGRSDRLSTAAFIDAQIEALAAAELPFVYEAYVDAGKWEELDALQALWLFANPAAFRASQLQGQGLLRCAISGLVKDTATLDEARRKILDGRMHGLVAPLFGVVCKLMGIDPVTAQRMYLFLALRDMVSAAKRLALIGPMSAIRLQSTLAGKLEEYVAKYKNRGVESVKQTFPLGDLVHSCHDDLFRKLFIS